MEQSVILKPEHIKCHMRMLLDGLGYLHDNFVLHRVRRTSSTQAVVPVSQRYCLLRSAKPFGVAQGWQCSASFHQNIHIEPIFWPLASKSDAAVQPRVLFGLMVVGGAGTAARCGVLGNTDTITTHVEDPVDRWSRSRRWTLKC